MTANASDNAGQNTLSSIADTAAKLGKSERTIRRWIRAGKLKTVDIGGQVYVQAEAFDTPADMSGEGVHVSAESDRMSGQVSGEVVEVLKDTIRRQDAEIGFLRTEVSAIRSALENVTRMLPAPARSEEPAAQKTERKSRVWLWILLAVVILSGAGAGGYWLWLMK